MFCIQTVIVHRSEKPHFWKRILTILKMKTLKAFAMTLYPDSRNSCFRCSSCHESEKARTTMENNRVQLERQIMPCGHKNRNGNETMRNC